MAVVDSAIGGDNPVDRGRVAARRIQIRVGPDTAGKRAYGPSDGAGTINVWGGDAVRAVKCDGHGLPQYLIQARRAMLRGRVSVPPVLPLVFVMAKFALPKVFPDPLVVFVLPCGKV